MLENVLGQDHIVGILRQELGTDGFPRAVLFHGPPYSAKLTAALEVARALTCQRGDGQWTCPCASCERHRLLVHPHLLLLGSRYFAVEMAAGADVLVRTRQAFSQYLFIRAVRKLTRRFDPVLWEGEESRVSALKGPMEEVEGILDELAPGRELPPEQALEKRIRTVLTHGGRLIGALNAENIPIHQIRQTAAWLHLSTATGAVGVGSRKVVIVENADKMFEASGSSLLKLLEQPPPRTHLILTTARKGALLSTVLSRLRRYGFVERSREGEQEILRRIFHEESSDFNSLRDYFLTWREVNPVQLRKLARGFLSGPEETEAAGEALAEAKALAAKKNGRETAAALLEELVLLLQGLLEGEGAGLSRLERWNRLVRDHAQALERLNQSPLLVLESLFYSLRAAA